MAGAPESVIIDKDKAPDILGDVAGFKLEDGRLVSVDETGQTHRVPNIGRFALQLMTEMGVAQETAGGAKGGDTSRQVQLLEQQLATERQQHQQILDQMRQQHEVEMQAVLDRYQALEARVQEMQERLDYPELNTDDYDWTPKEGDQVTVKRDGNLEDNWRIFKVSNTGDREISAWNGDPDNEPITKPLNIFLHWQLEANKAAKRSDKTLEERLKDEYGDNWIPRNNDQVGQILTDGYLDEGWVVVGDPYEKDDNWVIKINKAGTEMEVPLANLVRQKNTEEAGNLTDEQRQQLAQLETELSAINAIDQDGFYQQYRQNLQSLANSQPERLTDDAGRQAFMDEQRAAQINEYFNNLPEDQRTAENKEKLTRWTQLRDIQEGPITPATQPLPTVRGQRVEVNTLSNRLRNHMPFVSNTREYNIDDRGRYYYLNDSGEAVYVTEAEVTGRRFGAAALVAAGVVLYAAWELIGERVFGEGHGSSKQFSQQVINQVQSNRHIEMKAIAAQQHLEAINHAKEMKAISGLNHHLDQVEIKLHKEHVHDHFHELRAINGNEDGPSSYYVGGPRPHGIGAVHDKMKNTGAYWGVRYPWDWAANKVGAIKAEGWLHGLASKAASHGHKVKWIKEGILPNGSRNEILQVDGQTSTQKVVAILNQYK